MKLLADIQLTTPPISEWGTRVDALYGYLNLVTIIFTVGIFGAIILFCVKYKRKSEDDRPEEIHGNNLLEIIWSVIPFLLTLVMFVWGTTLAFEADANQCPPNALDIKVTGKQWMWKVQHPGLQGEINDLHVPAGQPIRLTISSEDVLHSYYIPALRLKKDAVPGKLTYMWFEIEPEAARPEPYQIFCAEYCGTKHSRMRGKLYVHTPQGYAEWLDSMYRASPYDLPETKVELNELAKKGKQIFGVYCASCHPPGVGVTCPSVVGIHGEEVEYYNEGNMAELKTTTRDYDYLYESIMEPMKKRVKGWTGPAQIMTPMGDAVKLQYGEEGIIALIEYIKALGN